MTFRNVNVMSVNPDMQDTSSKMFADGIDPFNERHMLAQMRHVVSI